MPIYKDKNGTYYFRVYAKDDNGINKQYTKRGFKTKAEANEQMRLFAPLKEISQKKLYLHNVSTIFFIEDEKKNKYGTIRFHHYMLNTIAEAPFYEKDMHKITSNEIRKWHLDLAAAKGSKRANRILSLLNSLFEFSKIAPNPCADVHPIKEDIIEEDDDIDAKYISQSEFKAFIYTFLPNEYDRKVFFIFLYQTGLRRCEARAIQFKDIDIYNNIVKVRKQIIDKQNGEWMFGTPKTKSSKRDVYVPDSLIEILKPLVQSNNPNFFLLGGIKPISNKTLNNIAKKHFKQIGVDHSLHDFRHSFVTNLLLAGCDLKYTSEMAGHSSVLVTAKVYHHLADNVKKVNNEIVKKL